MAVKPTYEQLDQKVRELECTVAAREAEAAELRRSLEQFKRLFERAPLGYQSLDENGRFIEVNQAWLEILGYRRDEVIGKPFGNFLLPDEKKRFEYYFQRFKAVGEILGGEFEMRKKDGKTILVSFHGKIGKGSDGGFQQTHCIFIDISERLKMETALKESETLLRSIIRSIPDLIWLKDIQGVYMTCNPRFERFFGAREADIVGKTDYAFVDADLADFFRDHDRAAIAKGVPSMNEEEVIFAADGHREILETIKTPIYTSDGDLLGVLGIGRDITKRKQEEEDRRRSDARYRTLFDYAPYGMVIADRESYYLDANPRICQMLGYTRDEFIGLHASDIVVPDEVEHIDPALREIESPSDHNRTWRFRRKDGSTFYADVTATTMPDGLLLGVIRDSTAQQRAAAELRESEKKLRLFIEHAPAALAMFDRHMHYLAVSRRWIADFDLADRQIIGRSHYDLFPEIPDRWKAVHARVMAGEAARSEEDVFERLDGQVQWLQWEVRPWFRADGTVGGIVIFSADLTERKHMEAERAKLQAQLLQSQKMESVGRLAGGVAHDYNNMLSVIIGYAELVLEQIDPNDQIYEDIIEIHQAGKRSMDITRQLLAFARKQTIAPRVIDLNETMEHSLKMLRRLIGEAIALNWHPRTDIWPVYIDSGQVDQILANLCVNARDAIADTGTITIATNHGTLDEAYCAKHTDCVPGDYVMLTFSDSGHGMPQETLNKIFEPFFTTKAVGTGTGLGLATVYGIVKQNRGFINVYSEPGKGTTFTIHLPRHRGAPIIDAEEVVEAIPRGRGETVLVVEDEAAILNVARQILVGLDYHVLLAGTPAEALALAHDHDGEIALLVTDVIMPGMNGRELADRLQTDFPDMKTLFMSGYTTDLIAHHGVLDEGVNYLQKPFSKWGLAVKVRKSLEGR